MSEPLATPNIEAQAIVYLAPLLSVDVLRVLPDPLPSGPFVRVMLTGTRRVNLTLLERRLTVECWAAIGRDADAEDLSSRAFAYLNAWQTDSTWVPQNEDGWTAGPYADIDPETKRPRYVMTANVRQGVTAV